MTNTWKVLSIDSIKYKRYLSKLYRENTGSSISDNSINTAITNLSAEAEFNGCIIPLHLRTAWGSSRKWLFRKVISIIRCIKKGLSLYIRPLA